MVFLYGSDVGEIAHAGAVPSPLYGEAEEAEYNELAPEGHGQGVGIVDLRRVAAV